MVVFVVVYFQEDSRVLDSDWFRRFGDKFDHKTEVCNDQHQDDYAINALWNDYGKMLNVRIHLTNLQYMRENAEGRIDNYVPHFSSLLRKRAKSVKTPKPEETPKKGRKKKERRRKEVAAQPKPMML